MKPTILFTSPCGPYAKLPLDRDPIDYFYYRNTYRQKMFQLRSFQSWHSLHFIAQNIAVPSVVMENPTMTQFQKEVEGGEYQVVAIGFTMLLTKKVLEMVQWLKQNHPRIEVVLGGYGTAVFKERFETSDLLQSLADHICYGEGVSFMNAIIATKWNIVNGKSPLHQDLLPAKNSFFRTRIKVFNQMVLVGGLGCVYGCSFCATSSQFNKKYISLFTGKQLVESLLQQSRKYPHIQSAIIYEEDFLQNRSKVMEFMAEFQNTPLSKKPFLVTVFASLQSIMKYSVDELISCGIGTIFIGVESLSKEVLQKEGLGKRKGEIEQMFTQLHAHGINTLGSLIIGWDSQDAEVAQADSARFVKLNPTFYQVVPLHVVPGTKLWEKMKAEKRISADYKFETDGITNFNFKEKNFAHDEARALVFSTYAGLVTEGGPWPFRMFENLVRGYKNMSQSENKNHSERARTYRAMMFPLCLLAFTSRFFFSGNGFTKRWSQTMRGFSSAFPLRFAITVVLSPVVAFLLCMVYLSGNLKYRLSKDGDQPDYIRVEYN